MPPDMLKMSTIADGGDAAMPERSGARLAGRVLLVVLSVFALLLVAPDLLRVFQPLDSVGLAANDDGLIYDVHSPFPTEADSPAWRAGIRVGDRLDLPPMRCIPIRTSACASMLALWGGMNYLVPGRKVTLSLLPSGDHPARTITLVARQIPPTTSDLVVLVLDQVAGILVVLGAAWLVWIRPGWMTWGFFAYAIEFNPGQGYQFYAWLQLWPAWLLVQSVVNAALMAAGYMGFLLFALRVPGDRSEGRWQRIGRLLPVPGLVIFGMQLISLGSVFGYRSEMATRAGLLIGFVVDVAALAILFGRRNSLAPRDYQRIRWVIWGCLIGLPAFLIGQISQETSLPHSLLGLGAVPDDVTGLFFLVNGILCLFVTEAVRRPTVISVTIPLRRATMLGLLLSIPAFLLHTKIELIDEFVHLPGWAWLLVASVLAFLITKLHELATELADRLFDRDLQRAEARLVEAGRAIQRAESFAEIERLLVEEPVRALRLASAAAFRDQDGSFRRRASAGWDDGTVETLREGDPILAGRQDGAVFLLAPAVTADAGLPLDLARPVLGVPVGNARRCFAVVLYGSHEDGTALESHERTMLGGLARHAEIAYAQVESAMLRSRVAALEGALARASVAV
jgi:hypothetical protein